MATANPFDLLGADDGDDPSLLIAAAQAQAQLLPASKPKKSPAPAQAAAQGQPAKLPSKPLPPAQAVREARNDGGRGEGRGGGRGFGRGRGGGGRGFERDAGRGFDRDAGRGFDRDGGNTENAFSNTNGYSGGYKPSDDGNSGRSFERRGGPRGPFRGERRGGFSNGEAGEGERPRRVFERRSGTGRGSEIKRDGAGRGNWGTPDDEIAPETEEAVKNVSSEKPIAGEESADAAKDAPEKEPEEKEPEDKEMTLEEYQKVLEEKRKVLQAEKAQERKVDLDKEFKSMQLLSNKKDNDEVFIKLGSEKDKRRDAAEKDDKKKAVSINEFLKPADGERYYSPGGRGRGRGRGTRGGYTGGVTYNNVAAPSIEDPGQFPTLGGKQ
ncbi:hypothetical protein MLD38_018380 [Melastoma candidum]|uniref:Uncharacterized protein n=1 Tax=Melastoma candidum TaxID=119954 RepID=A0ACB9QUY5_9MYRT|nr:hypothetical protein MLD38_018380 [Melastoma candidum]